MSSVRLHFHVLTVFPEMIKESLGYGVVSQSIKSGLLAVAARSPREFTKDVHQTIDDRPFGGGDGMIMLAEPLSQLLHSVRESIPGAARVRVIHMSPRGKPFSDAEARRLANDYDHLVIVASRYGGVDQRFLNDEVDEEISIGDYVLSGGEIPALAVVDAVSRCVPGVLGNEQSANLESFAPGLGLLEGPQFTRPRQWHGADVPAVLCSGNHAEIKKWQEALALLTTVERRPDLLGDVNQKSRQTALKVLDALSDEQLKVCGVSAGREILRDRLLEPARRQG